MSWLKKKIFKTIRIDHGDRVEYTLDGKKHRDDGPAVIYPNGDKCWFKNGHYHRIDGPAIEYGNGTKEWYIDGAWMSEREFNNRK